MADIDNFLTKMLDEQFSFETKARMLGHEKDEDGSENEEDSSYKNNFDNFGLGTYSSSSTDQADDELDNSMPRAPVTQEHELGRQRSFSIRETKRIAISRPVGKHPEQRCYLHPAMFHLNADCRQQYASNSQAAADDASRNEPLSAFSRLRSASSSTQPGREPSAQCWLHPTLKHLNSECHEQRKASQNPTYNLHQSHSFDSEEHPSNDQQIRRKKGPVALSRKVGKLPDDRCYLHPTLFHLNTECKQQNKISKADQSLIFNSPDTQDNRTRQSSDATTDSFDSQSHLRPAERQVGMQPNDRCYVHPNLFHTNHNCKQQLGSDKVTSDEPLSNASQDSSTPRNARMARKGSSNTTVNSSSSENQSSNTQQKRDPSGQCTVHPLLSHTNSECRQQQPPPPHVKTTIMKNPVGKLPHERCHLHPELFHKNVDCKAQQCANKASANSINRALSDPNQNQQLQDWRKDNHPEEQSSFTARQEHDPSALCWIHPNLKHVNSECHEQQRRRLAQLVTSSRNPHFASQLRRANSFDSEEQSLLKAQAERDPQAHCYLHPQHHHVNSACCYQQDLFKDAIDNSEAREDHRKPNNGKNNKKNNKKNNNNNNEQQQSQGSSVDPDDEFLQHLSLGYDDVDVADVVKTEHKRMLDSHCNLHPDMRHTNGECRAQQIELMRIKKELMQTKMKERKIELRNVNNPNNPLLKAARDATNANNARNVWPRGDPQQMEQSDGLPPPKERAVGMSASDRCRIHRKSNHTNSECSEQQHQYSGTHATPTNTTTTPAQDPISWLPKSFPPGLGPTPIDQSRQQLGPASAFAAPRPLASSPSSSLTDNTWFSQNGISLAYLAPQPLHGSQSQSPPPLTSLPDPSFPLDYSNKPTSPPLPPLQLPTDITCREIQSYYPKPHELVRPGDAGDAILDTVCTFHVLNTPASFLTMTPVHDVAIKVSGGNSIKVEGFGIAVFHLRADGEITDDPSSILYTFAAPALWVPSSPVCIISDRLLDAHLLDFFGDTNVNNARIGLVTDVTSGRLEDQCIKVFRGSYSPLKVASSHSPGVTVLRGVIHTPFDRSSFSLSDVHADMSDLSFLQVRMNLVTMMDFKTKPAESIYRA